MNTAFVERKATTAEVLKTGLEFGAIGGIIGIFVGVEGMLQAFNVRDIVSGIITTSEVLVLLIFFATAYLAVSRCRSTNTLLTFATGAISSVVAGAFLIGLVALGGVIRLGDMFINAVPDLYNLLTFHQGLVNGSVYLLIVALAAGVVASLAYFLPSLPRRAIVYGLVAIFAFGLLQDLIKVTLSNWAAFAPLVKFLFESNGLTIPGAAVVFVLVAGLALFRSTQGSRVQDRLNSLPAASQKGLRGASVVLLVVVLLLMPLFLGLYLSDVLDTVGLYLLMGLGLNIVVGFAGMLDLGYVAFYAIGAYTVGILTSPEHATGILHNWWLALPFGVLAALSAGIILGIPVLKMRGDYLAIVTLGFGEIIRLLANSDFLKPWEGGPQGIQGIPLPDVGPIRFVQMQLSIPLLGQFQFTPSQEFYYLFLAGCLLVMFVATRVKVSRIGRAWMAIREDEDVAQAMGINLVATKLMAFGMGASFGGLSGAIFASKLQSVYPTSFTFLTSVYVLSLIIVGGMGSIPGVVVGALALVGLPELLREVGDYRYLFFGAALVLMMLIRPEGLLPEARRRLELEEFKEEEAEAEARQEPAAA
ncbi:MAG: leucine/isoleucine/valine transporter permease subunit [Chloroflexi bacterium]|nr:leucine/isoleucine/valine transporter permease subunit [Chloroflexota bacterium]